MVTCPLSGKPSIRIGYILPRDGRPTPEAQNFITHLVDAVADAICHSQALHRSLGFVEFVPDQIY